MHKPQNLTEFMLCLHHQSEFCWPNSTKETALEWSSWLWTYLHLLLGFNSLFLDVPAPKKLCCYPAYHLLNARTCICPLHWLIALNSSIDIFQMGYASKFIGSPSSSQAQISPPNWRWSLQFCYAEPDSTGCRHHQDCRRCFPTWSGTLKHHERCLGLKSPHSNLCCTTV